MRVGQRRQNLARREGDVQEISDRAGEAGRPDLAAERNEMVVVHPDQIVGLQKRREACAHALVDAPEPFGETAIIAGEIHAVVEHGPKRLIGEAVVEIGKIGRASCRR